MKDSLSLGSTPIDRRAPKLPPPCHACHLAPPRPSDTSDTGLPPPTRALCTTTHPSLGARRMVCPQREPRPARVPVRLRGPADGPCTSPSRRRPNPRVATPSADRERARCRVGRALPAPWRADGVSMGRPRPLLRAGDQGKGSLRRPLYDQFEARPHRGLTGPSPPPTHHLVLPTPARPPSMSTRAMW